MNSKSKKYSAPVARTKGLVLRCDYREDDFALWPRPSELQLAQIAAQLARTEKIDPKQLVEEAWELYWESCRVIKRDQGETKEFLDRIENDDDHFEERCESLPVPKCYPVSFKKVELLLLPKLKGRTADRAKIMRDFLFDDYVQSRWKKNDQEETRTEVVTAEQLERLREESKEELDDLFGQMRAMTFDARFYTAFAQHFLAWYRQSAGFIKSTVRSNSARRRWEESRKNKQNKTAARPNRADLKEILAPKKFPLDGSNA